MKEYIDFHLTASRLIEFFVLDCEGVNESKVAIGEYVTVNNLAPVNTRWLTGMTGEVMHACRVIPSANCKTETSMIFVEFSAAEPNEHFDHRIRTTYMSTKNKRIVVPNEKTWLPFKPKELYSTKNTSRTLMNTTDIGLDTKCQSRHVNGVRISKQTLIDVKVANCKDLSVERQEQIAQSCKLYESPTALRDDGLGTSASGSKQKIGRTKQCAAFSAASFDDVDGAATMQSYTAFVRGADIRTAGGDKGKRKQTDTESDDAGSSSKAPK